MPDGLLDKLKLAAETNADAALKEGSDLHGANAHDHAGAALKLTQAVATLEKPSKPHQPRSLSRER